MEVNLKDAVLVDCATLKAGAAFLPMTPGSWGWSGVGFKCSDNGPYSAALGINLGIPQVRAWDTRGGGAVRVIPLQIDELSLELGPSSGAAATEKPGELLINAEAAFLTVLLVEAEKPSVCYLNLRTWQTASYTPDAVLMAFRDWKLISRRGDQKAVLFGPPASA